MRRSTILRPGVLLGFFLLLGLILRMIFFESATFGYDQARDAFQALSIITDHNLKIIGPTTDIKGLFHGPIFWYLISPFYYLSGGNPLAARFLMVLINLVNVIFIYHIAKKIFKDEKIALVSSFLFAISFEATQYARWISNPPPALFFSALFFFGLWYVLQKRSSGLPIMVLAWSFAIDFQRFLIYQAVFLVFAFLYLFATDRKVILKNFKTSRWVYLGSFLVLLPLCIAQVKFKFLGVQAALSFLTAGDKSSEPLLPKLANFYHKLIDNVAYNLTGHNVEIATILFLGLIGGVMYWLITKKQYRHELLLLLIWFISPILIYPFEKNNAYFLNIGNIYPLILIASFFIIYISRKLRQIELPFIIFTVLLIASLNIYLVVTHNRDGETLFSVQYRQTLDDEKKVIDYLYEDSGKKAFAFNTITNPLFVNSTWAYLFDWYGKKKFGYMPVWLGYPLDDVGKDVQFAHFNDDQQGHLFYLIIESPAGIRTDYVKAFIAYENTRSTILNEKKIGYSLVQKRRLINNNGFVRESINEYLFGGRLYHED